MNIPIVKPKPPDPEDYSNQKEYLKDTIKYRKKLIDYNRFIREQQIQEHLDGGQ